LKFKNIVVVINKANHDYDVIAIYCISGSFTTPPQDESSNRRFLTQMCFAFLLKGVVLQFIRTGEE
jgi:hypothetical protein